RSVRNRLDARSSQAVRMKVVLGLIGVGLAIGSWLAAPRLRTRPSSSGAAGIGLYQLADRLIAPNLLQNPSFEQNWFNRPFTMNRRFLLLQGSDMGVGEADGHVDHWRFEGISIPEAWDVTVARTGGRSVRFEKAGRGTQLVRLAGETHWPDGGSGYNYFLPMERKLAAQIVRRPIVVGAWCRTKDVPAGGEPQLTLSVELGVRPNYDNSPAAETGKAEASVAFSAGTHDCESRDLRLD